MEEYDRAASLGRAAGNGAFTGTDIQVSLFPVRLPSPQQLASLCDPVIAGVRDRHRRGRLCKSHGDPLACCRMQVCKAQALAALGGAYRDAAALLVSEALRADPEHEGALLEYVAVVLDRGLVRDALRILLRLLVKSHGDARVRSAPSLHTAEPSCMITEAGLPY